MFCFDLTVKRLPMSENNRWQCVTLYRTKRQAINDRWRRIMCCREPDKLLKVRAIVKAKVHKLLPILLKCQLSLFNTMLSAIVQFSSQEFRFNLHTIETIDKTVQIEWA